MTSNEADHQTRHADACDECGAELVGMVIVPWGDDEPLVPVLCGRCGDHGDEAYVRQRKEDEVRWFPALGESRSMSP